jgi:hypothetical protein
MHSKHVLGGKLFRKYWQGSGVSPTLKNLPSVKFAISAKRCKRITVRLTDGHQTAQTNPTSDKSLAFEKFKLAELRIIEFVSVMGSHFAGSHMLFPLSQAPGIDVLNVRFHAANDSYWRSASTAY